MRAQINLPTFSFYLLLTLFLTLHTFNQATAQNRTWLSVESGFANDLYSLTDNGGYIRQTLLDNAPFGLNVRHEFKNHFFLETGAMMKYYQNGYSLSIVPEEWAGLAWISSSEPSWIFPLRIGAPFSVLRRKLIFSPLLGCAMGIDIPFGYGISYGSHSYGGTTINITREENPNVSRFISLAQMGGNFEFALFRELVLTLGASYYLGFNTINQWDVSYTVNNNDTYTGTFISKGSFWYIHSGLSYPISNIWDKRSFNAVY